MSFVGELLVAVAVDWMELVEMMVRFPKNWFSDP